MKDTWIQTQCIFHNDKKKKIICIKKCDFRAWFVYQYYIKEKKSRYKNIYYLAKYTRKHYSYCTNKSFIAKVITSKIRTKAFLVS